MRCPKCGGETTEEYSFCTQCGASLPKGQNPGQQPYNPPIPGPIPPYYQDQTEAKSAAKNYAYASIIMGVTSFIALPIIFTPLGVFFGALSLKRQREGNRLAIAGIVISIVGFIADVLLTFLLYG